MTGSRSASKVRTLFPSARKKTKKPFHHLAENVRRELLPRLLRVLRVERGDLLGGEVAQQHVLRDDVERADLPKRLAIRANLRLVVAHVQHPDERDGGWERNGVAVDVPVAQLPEERDEHVAEQTVRLVEEHDERLARAAAKIPKRTAYGKPGTATGRFEGSGTVNLSGANVYDFSGNGSRYNFNAGTTIRQAVINSESTVNNGVIRVEDTEFNGRVNLNGGTYSEVVVNGDWSVGGYISLDGDMTFRRRGSINSAIDGNGFTVNLDLSDRTTIDSAMLNINRLYNAELRVVLDQRQPVGTYVLGSNASQIGEGDAKGVYDGNTNKWLFKGQTIGDLDNIISIYDNNGVELANCTVNGDTEYFGRYNYTVFVDNNGELKLKVGWNNRDGLTYAADDYEVNDTRNKATVISGNGKDVILDCTNLEYIASSGLRILLGILKGAQATGSKVIMRGVSDDIKNVFELTGLISIFEFE